MTIINPLLGTTGRLGNQLWEIASTLGIASRYNDSVKFPYWEYTPFFNLPGYIFSPPGLPPIGTSVYELPDSQHLGDHAPYLQDYSFFSHMAPVIRRGFEASIDAEEELARPDLAWFWEIEGIKRAVHIRRGDNATAHLRNEFGFHPLRPMSYYVDACNDLSPCDAFVVFSDDLDWCRENFVNAGGQPVYYFEGGPGRARECEDRYMVEPARDWIDLIAMATCDQFVLSNSSYSWWGAFLSGVDGSMIRYPDASVFFGSKLKQIDASLMFPPDWVPVLHEQV